MSHVAKNPQLPAKAMSWETKEGHIGTLSGICYTNQYESIAENLSLRTMMLNIFRQRFNPSFLYCSSLSFCHQAVQWFPNFCTS